MTMQPPVSPTITERPGQRYVGVTKLVTMQTIGEIADRIPEIFGWLGTRGIEPAGAPFLRYHVIDMERELEIEAGVPIDVAVPGDGVPGDGVPGGEPVRAGVLPAGRYVTLTHTGHPDQLIDVTAALLDWASRQGLVWDMSDSPAGQRWGCRLETFLTNPAEEPDPNRWETELAFRLAD